jgi:hypothetical protein
MLAWYVVPAKVPSSTIRLIKTHLTDACKGSHGSWEAYPKASETLVIDICSYANMMVLCLAHSTDIDSLRRRTYVHQI